LKHVNGHVNGASVDAKLLGPSARDAEMVDVEPVSDDERFVTQSKKGPLRGSDGAPKPPVKGSPNTP
jgi:hypothetical protein